MRQARILIGGDFPLIPPVSIGGIQAVTWQLTSGLQALGGLDLHVSACEKWWPNPEGRHWERQYDGIMVHYSRSPSWLPHLVSCWTVDARDMANRIRRVKPDLVHAHGQTGYSVAAIRSGRPHVVTIHGLLAHEAAIRGGGIRLTALLRRRLWTMQENWILAHAAHIVVISPHVRSQIENRTQSVLHHIENPVGTEFFSLVREPRRPPTILSVGWIDPRKRHEIVIEAVAIALRDIPDLRLRIVGSPTPGADNYRESLRDLCRRLGLEQTVQFLSNIGQEALLDEYRTAAALALASVEESSPVAIGQAMAAGLPVVVVDIPGVRHLVHEGITGCVVREPNPAAMADSLVSLVQDEKMSRALGAEGRRQATRRFMPAAVARRTRDLYRRILEEDGSVPRSYSAPQLGGPS